MPFNYSVQLDDPNNLGGPADATLVYDLQQALGVWSDYINGLGTLVVDLKIANTPTGRASGGPTSSVLVGTNSNGLNVYESSGFYELTTGNHVNGTTSDITVTVSPSYFPNLDLASGLTYGSQVPSNEYNPIVVFLHELTHGLGWSGFYSQSGVLSGNAESTYDTFIQITPSGTAYFTGPNTEAIYGGPVELTTSSTAGENYYHLGNTLSDRSKTPATVQDPLTLDLMNGVVAFFDHQYPISDIDLGVLRDLGYIIVPSQFVGTGDFDSDSDRSGDALWQNPDGTIVAWDLNGPQLANQTVVGQVPANWHVVGTGDFNGDGNSDAVLQSTDGHVIVWLMNGANVVSQAVVGQIPANWHFAATGDFNGDGKSDILLQSDSGGVVMWQMNGAQVASDTFLGQIPTNWHVAGVGDVNHDGVADIFLHSDSGGIVVWEMNGAHVVVDQFLGQIPSNWHFAATGDFNGDGKVDVLFVSDAGGVVMWAMNGTQVLANQFIGQVPSNWHVAGTGDFNNDGKTDILWTDDTGASLVWEMNGTSVVADQLVGPNQPPAGPPAAATLEASMSAASAANDAAMAQMQGMDPLPAEHPALLAASTGVSPLGNDPHGFNHLAAALGGDLHPLL